MIPTPHRLKLITHPNHLKAATHQVAAVLPNGAVVQGVSKGVSFEDALKNLLYSRGHHDPDLVMGVKK